LMRSASRIDRSIVQLDQLPLGPNSLTSRFRHDSARRV
jgi:hypothetical protein